MAAFSFLGARCYALFGITTFFLVAGSVAGTKSLSAMGRFQKRMAGLALLAGSCSLSSPDAGTYCRSCSGYGTTVGDAGGCTLGPILWGDCLFWGGMPY